LRMSLTVNGRAWSGDVPARLTLSDFLRERLGLTGTHVGCEQGVCGACTILADGEAVRSCLMLAVQADGMHLTTIEGMAEAGQLSTLQAAFLRHRAFQCGFCTPGFLTSATEILHSGRRYSREELRDLLSGNICRCSGYEPIVEAVFECQT
jgi:aerobic-type carbon monoxide dehydrogenase small subunit (CoxS/CutS family)